MLTKKLHIGAVVLALGILLAGCSGTSGSSSPEATTSAKQSAETTETETDTETETTTEQSKADACAVVQETLTEFSEVSAALDPSDTQAMVDQFKELSASSGAALTAITNVEVAPAASAAAAGLNDYVVFLETIITDPTQASALGDQITALTDSITEVSTVCAS